MWVTLIMGSRIWYVIVTKSIALELKDMSKVTKLSTSFSGIMITHQSMPVLSSPNSQDKISLIQVG